MSFQIKFHHIRAFVEVAREGSIRGASRALAISQPALTKAIKELEEGLSAQLFVRRSQGGADRKWRKLLSTCEPDPGRAAGGAG
jgi:LysR family transcriptional regulator of abg operon